MKNFLYFETEGCTFYILFTSVFSSAVGRFRCPRGGYFRPVLMSCSHTTFISRTLSKEDSVNRYCKSRSKNPWILRTRIYSTTTDLFSNASDCTHITHKHPLELSGPQHFYNISDKNIQEHLKTNNFNENNSIAKH